MSPDPEALPERPPLVVSVWSGPGCHSFSPLPGRPVRRIVVPFPLAPQVDLDLGIVLTGLYTNGPAYDARATMTMAGRQEGGFRFVEGETR